MTVAMNTPPGRKNASPAPSSVRTNRRSSPCLASSSARSPNAAPNCAMSRRAVLPSMLAEPPHALGAHLGECLQRHERGASRRSSSPSVALVPDGEFAALVVVRRRRRRRRFERPSCASVVPRVAGSSRAERGGGTVVGEGDASDGRRDRRPRPQASSTAWSAGRPPPRRRPRGPRRRRRRRGGASRRRCGAPRRRRRLEPLPPRAPRRRRWRSRRAREERRARERA